jgi:hypothetical protein
MRLDSVAMIFASVASGSRAASITSCRAITLWPRRCGFTLAPPASQRIQRESAGRIREGR